MKRSISQYDKLRALVRNPEYLRDLNFVQKGYSPEDLKDENGQLLSPGQLNALNFDSLPNGFSQKATSWFLSKYNLSVIVTPELLAKYTKQDLESLPVFNENDCGVQVNLGEKPTMVELEPGLFKHDYSDCFKKNKILTLRIDLSKSKGEILQKVSRHIDFFGKYLPQSTSRKKGDQKVDRFLVWDEYAKVRSFSKIAKDHDLDRTTIRKAYLRVFEDIMGEKFDPEKHDRGRLDKSQLKITCDICPQRETCDTPCPNILSYISQDEVRQHDLIVPELSFPPSD